MTGLAGLTRLGEAKTTYDRTEDPALREVTFTPPVAIAQDGEYLIVIDLVSTVPDALGGYEPISVNSGNAYPGGRGFNLRMDGVTNAQLWEDLDYLISMRGSAVPD